MALDQLIYRKVLTQKKDSFINLAIIAIYLTIGGVDVKIQRIMV